MSAYCQGPQYYVVGTCYAFAHRTEMMHSNLDPIPIEQWCFPRALVGCQSRTAYARRQFWSISWTGQSYCFSQRSVLRRWVRKPVLIPCRCVCQNCREDRCLQSDHNDGLVGSMVPISGCRYAKAWLLLQHSVTRSVATPHAVSLPMSRLML